MKKIKLVLLISFALCLVNCKNSSTTSDSPSNKTYSIEEKRIAYLQSNYWLAPEDMELFTKCAIPYSERKPMDENERKQAIIGCLRNSNISELRIKKMVDGIEQIHGGRSGQWNYEYILARFENYKSDMSNDSTWKKIETEYQLKLKLQEK